MSASATAWVFENSQTHGNARLVMLALARSTGENGWACPGTRELAKMTRLSERTVSHLIRKLLEMGELESAEDGPACFYRIVMDRGEATN